MFFVYYLRIFEVQTAVGSMPYSRMGELGAETEELSFLYLQTE